MPSGWVGKPWALQQGLAAATTAWVVTLDADTVPGPGLLAALVRRCQTDGWDFLSVGARFRCAGHLQQLVHASMLTTLVYRFGPPGSVRRRAPARTMANGQCTVFRREALLAAGGFAAAASHLTDDVALARHLAALGWRVGFLDGTRAIDVRMHDSLAETWRDWGRSLPMPDVTSPGRQVADLAVVLLAQALPLARLVTGRADVLDLVLLAAAGRDPGGHPARPTGARVWASGCRRSPTCPSRRGSCRAPSAPSGRGGAGTTDGRRRERGHRVVPPRPRAAVARAARAGAPGPRPARAPPRAGSALLPAPGYRPGGDHQRVGGPEADGAVRRVGRRDGARRRSSPAPRIARRWRSAEEVYTVRLRALRGHGTWRGVAVLDGLAAGRADGPVAVLTRADVRLRRWLPFLGAGPAVSDAVQQAPGLLAVVGVGEAPLGRQATFSLWSSAAHLEAFAAGHPAHRRVVERTRAERWYGEELFARFEPCGPEGTWDGRDPLAGFRPSG